MLPPRFVPSDVKRVKTPQSLHHNPAPSQPQSRHCPESPNHAIALNLSETTPRVRKERPSPFPQNSIFFFFSFPSLKPQTPDPSFRSPSFRDLDKPHDPSCMTLKNL